MRDVNYYIECESKCSMASSMKDVKDLLNGIQGQGSFWGGVNFFSAS